MSSRSGLALAALFFLRTGAAAAPETAAGAPAAEEFAGWEFNARVYGYFPPEDLRYAQPRVTADRGALQLETRDNNEA